MLKFDLLPPREYEPNPEQIGKNAEVRLIFIRHGEKDPKDRERGLLTEKGKQEFRDFVAKELNDPNRSLVCYGTEIARTIQSSMEALKSACANIKVFPEPLDELDMHIGESMDKGRKSRFSRNFIETMKGMPQGHNVKQYLTYGDKRPDETTYSPREFAGGLAKIILGYDAKIDKFKSGNKSDVLLVSHDFVLSTFIQEVLHEQFSTEHSTLRTAEFFEVVVKTDEKGQHTMECVYNGKHFNLDLDMLKDLAQKYEEAENKT